ncbi:hypothetical protein AK972_3778 [Pseudomonas yamanorum]|uniref:DUF6482 family protein n=1 Tax=Pseudomonas yamanorum TaxID=515393 RepID=UPI0007A3A9AF|nr:DUF6482 family protein [Pseudomonas yamanorum]AMW84578.1 hypothetical protein AK972_3778 [Pseudomonas yamanorum]
MNLQTLTQLATQGDVREMELLSLDGGFYLARVRLDHGQFTLLDATAKPMRFRSVNHLRDVLQSVPAFPCTLVHQCVHDEMCGRREGPIEALRTPFSLEAPW